MDLNGVGELRRPRTRREIPPWQPGDAILAGGTWLFSEPQPALRRLIDLGGLDWPGPDVGENGVRIAATCTLAELAALALPAAWPSASLVAQCCGSLWGGFKIQGAATVGGNLCLALPAGPMIALCVALDASFTVWEPDRERAIRAEDFVLGPQRNALRPGELLREIELPASGFARRSAFRRISLTPLGRSAALLIGTMSPGGGFELVVTAATPRPVRLPFPALPAAEDLRARLERDIPASSYYDDVHGAPDWRRHVTLRLAEEIRRELSGEGPP